MVTSALYYIVLAGSLVVALPVLTVLLETFAAIALPEKTLAPVSGRKTRDRVGVLIPAHDEEEILPKTIAKIQEQLRHGDLLLVVADNCSDGTATVARNIGATVAIRSDPNNKGKGFALDWGIRYFSSDPPEVVIVIDADCNIGNEAIDYLVSLCTKTDRPVQALDLMISASMTSSTRVREFAWRVKNWVRPLGLNSMGLPCQLMGTGMAIPWKFIAVARLATGALAEDLKLGLELAASGHPPIFCAAATVTSEFPTTDVGKRSQQLRWEQGHLGTIATDIPRYLIKAIRNRDKNLLVLTLDAAVPPLSLLWILVLLFFVLGLGCLTIGLGSAVLLVSLGNLTGFICLTMACWLKAGRDLLPLGSVYLVGASALKKIPFYCRIFFQRSRQTWIRTDRRKL